MEFEQLRASWQKLGASDPRWAILSQDGRKDGRWDDEPFWQSGIDSIGWIARHLDGVRALPALGRALDFGCGIGRLSQALAHHFAEVVGVDIAQSMVDGARAANRHGPRVQYLVNPRPDLSLLDSASFDFAMTLIVLQHMRPQYAAVYLREFLRLLRKGGILFFQIPIEPAESRDSTGPATEAAAPPLPFALQAATGLLPPHRDLAASEWQWFRAEIHNTGTEVLRARGPGAVEVGTRYDRIDGTAASAIRWTPLPHDLQPGQHLSLLVADRAPATGGIYLFTALPCAGRRWFAHARNLAAIGRVTVGAPPPGHEPPDQPPPRPALAAPDGTELIEVYGTSLADLYATIHDAGGEFVDVCPDGWAGYEWISAHCVVRKR